ncbi:MAG TPA: 50S ribosomal protein L21 [Candidatus Paceibacterota bacterium]|jgi:large subunit ribosomal protein L21|nr:50S ribosomal protein L21 [Candidatus Paceibacterota bacterium]
MATKAKTTKKDIPADGEFAVIQTGGKQYMVSEGQVIKIEAMKGELKAEGREVYKVGDKLTFSEVLLSDNGKDATTIGTPFIDGAKVEAEITKIDRAKKVTVIKYKAKSNYFKKRGHRQPYFEVKITKVA